ncbi:MAG: efflux RND transporter periplasmic adaptor subunit [Desulfobulbaceae bacterium]|nr:efflux RND transporter periplasmic adaptor subunit [Desulfobulbaceae bacterium]
MPAVSFRFVLAPLVLLLLFAGAENAAAETVWTCSMHPQIQLPEAGQCPICFMDLIEVEKESNDNRQSLRQISFDDRARKLAQVEVRPVVRGKAATEIRMVGKVDYDETRVGTITSWVSGRIDKLFVDYTGSRVRRSQPMAKIYSPELLTAQAELIQASAALKRTEQSGNEIIKKTASRTLTASREKLRLLGLGNGQIEAIEKQGKPTDHITLTAPMSGIVIKKNVTEGMYVKTGTPIYTLADLDRVWVILEAYESDLQAITLGQQVLFSVESYPGTPFQGKVAYIDPLVDNKTRTIRVRLNVDNRDAKLKPGMFVRATAVSTASNDPDKQPLLIPASAPLVTGKRALVYVQLPDRVGVYVGREVILGQRRGDSFEVRSGLREGELVVTRGNFKIDSAIQLQARPSLMNPYMEVAADPNKPLPPLFVSRLNLLNRDFAELSKAVHEKNSVQQAAAVKKFTAGLAGIKAEKLDNDELLSWKELSMLLTSDIILLQEAENDQETIRMYSTMAEHFSQLRRRFGLHDEAAARLGSAELREKISLLIGRYLGLQQHLAADNLEDARKDGTAVAPLAETVIAGLRATGFDQAETFADQLSRDVEQLRAAENLADIRTAFSSLSETITRIVETFGSGENTPLYIQFCPMAFGNKGATWLAPSEEVNNPYFGTMMLNCGEVRRQITQ